MNWCFPSFGNVWLLCVCVFVWLGSLCNGCSRIFAEFEIRRCCFGVAGARWLVIFIIWAKLKIILRVFVLRILWLDIYYRCFCCQPFVERKTAFAPTCAAVRAHSCAEYKIWQRIREPLFPSICHAAQRPQKASSRRLCAIVFARSSMSRRVFGANRRAADGFIIAVFGEQRAMARNEWLMASVSYRMLIACVTSHREYYMRLARAAKCLTLWRSIAFLEAPTFIGRFPIDFLRSWIIEMGRPDT